MKWIKRLLSWREKRNIGKEQATELLEQLQNQALEVRKLTHSLRTEVELNHLGQRLRLAMERRYDNQ